MYHIGHFRENVRDIARPYHWHCTFGGEGNGSGPRDNALVTASMRTANMPGITINPVAVSYFGMIYNLAGTPSYEPFNASIIIDSEYATMNSWRSVLDNVFKYNKDDGPEWKAPDAYMGYIEMELLDTDRKTKNKYKLEHAWLSGISAVSYGHETKDTPLEFTATVTYSYYIKEIAGPGL